MSDPFRATTTSPSSSPHKGIVWIVTAVAGMLAIMVIVLAVVFSVSIVSFINANHERSCRERQNLYDGEFILTAFFAAELHATPAQTEKALADLKAKVGNRPTC